MYGFDSVFLGACAISWGGVDLGFTKGGVSIHIDTQTYGVTLDQFGDCYMGEYVISRNVVVSTELAETDVGTFYALYEQFNNGSTNQGVIVATETGLTMMPNARPLVLQPLNNDELDGLLIVPAATFDGQIEFSYSFEEEKVFSIQFTGYMDANGNMVSLMNPNEYYNINNNSIMTETGFILTDEYGTPLSYSS